MDGELVEVIWAALAGRTLRAAIFIGSTWPTLNLGYLLIEAFQH